MPTLEELEARLEALEQRILPTLTAEWTPEARKLEAQVNEQIQELRQQLAEQQRRVTGLGQATQQLEKALIQQFNGIDRRFDELTVAIRAQFESVSAPLTLLSVTTQTHNQQIGELRGQIGEVRQDMNSQFEATHQQIGEVRQEVAVVRQDMNGRFGSLDEKLNLILERLPGQ